MKTYIYKSVIVALFAGVALTSCSDFLDAENKTAGGQTADDYLGNNPQAMLTSAYESMKDIVFVPEIYSQGTDLYINTRGHDGGDFNTYFLTADNDKVADFYANVYKMINYANASLSYAGEASTIAQEARFIRAYGYYILTQQFGAVPYVTTYINNANTDYPRTPLSEIYPALIQDLTDLYNNSSLAAQSHEGHASKQAVAALLAKVNLAAGWDLETEYVDVAKGTYTTKGTNYFTEAAKWAETACSAGGFGGDLTMSFAEKWSPTNEKNAEEIFSVQYERNGYPGDVGTGGHSMENNFGGYYGECAKTGCKQVGSDNQQSEKSMLLFEKADLRWNDTFMHTFYNYNGSDWGPNGTGYYSYYGPDGPKGIQLEFFPYYWTEAMAESYFKSFKNKFMKGSYINQVKAAILSVPNVITYSFDAEGNFKKSTVSVDQFNAATENGVCVKKFDDPNSAQLGSKNDYRDIVLMHVSDLYLVAAEAYFMAGQTDKALEKVNQVRKRAGLVALGSFDEYLQNNINYNMSSAFESSLTPLDLILDERARELYAEGHRWMDLRRTKQLVRYNVEFNKYVTTATQMMDAAAKNYKLYRPIPTNEISSNTAISMEDQNPGYVVLADKAVEPELEK